MKKIISLAVISALLLLPMSGPRVIRPASASPLEVFPGYSIQDAINSASPGDTILVHSGTYHEHIEVNKTVALVGENRISTIVDGEGTETVVKVTADNANISGFTMRGSIRGIELYNCSSINISGNIVTDNMQYGIFLENSRNTTVCDNMVLDNGDRGVYLRSSDNNTIRNNTISRKHNQYGMLLIYSRDNIVSENIVSNITGWTGIRVDSSSNNIFSDNVFSRIFDIVLSQRNTLINNNLSSLSINGNTLHHFVQDIDSSNTVRGKPVCYWVNQHNKQVPSDAGYVALVNSTNIIVKDLNIVGNDRGVLLFSTTNSTIMNVNASQSSKGIELVYSPHNSVFANTLTSNSFGIFLDFSSNNSVFGNTMSQNDVGIFCLWCNNTIYHNNLINNTKQVEELISSNIWDNGYPSGGNYWSNHTSLDLYGGQYQDEIGSDGIGDTSHVIDIDSKDNYPLTGPIRFFDAGTWDETTYYVHTISNSVISNFSFSRNDRLVSFDVNGTFDTAGFCRVNIPKELLSCDSLPEWNVTVDGTQPTYLRAMEDARYTYLYFAYDHRTQEVQIKGVNVIPEVPTWTSTLLILIILAAAAVIYKRRILKTTIH